LTRLTRRPLERFLRIEAASGILLLVAAAVALGWANSPWAESYRQLWHTPVGVHVGAFSFERSLECFVNDGLMVIFFFVVGMEIRRELHHGELSEWRRAALPAAAALGGMLAPATLYLAIAAAPETRSGWGVPMATVEAVALVRLDLPAVDAATQEPAMPSGAQSERGCDSHKDRNYRVGDQIVGRRLLASGDEGVGGRRDDRDNADQADDADRP
jgi:Na+/H+ antiporter NhaA